MSEFDREVRDLFIDMLAEQIKNDPEEALRRGLSKAACDTLCNLTPEKLEFIHEHFFELFEFKPGDFEEFKASLRPN